MAFGLRQQEMRCLLHAFRHTSSQSSRRASTSRCLRRSSGRRPRPPILSWCSFPRRGPCGVGRSPRTPPQAEEAEGIVMEHKFHQANAQQPAPPPVRRLHQRPLLSPPPPPPPPPHYSVATTGFDANEIAAGADPSRGVMAAIEAPCGAGGAYVNLIAAAAEITPLSARARKEELRRRICRPAQAPWRAQGVTKGVAAGARRDAHPHACMDRIGDSRASVRCRR